MHICPKCNVYTEEHERKEMVDGELKYVRTYKCDCGYMIKEILCDG